MEFDYYNFRKRSESQCPDNDSSFPKLQRFPDPKFGFRLNSSDFAFLKTEFGFHSVCWSSGNIRKRVHTMSAVKLVYFLSSHTYLGNFPES